MRAPTAKALHPVAAEEATRPTAVGGVVKIPAGAAIPAEAVVAVEAEAILAVGGTATLGV